MPISDARAILRSLSSLFLILIMIIGLTSSATAEVKIATHLGGCDMVPGGRRASVEIDVLSDWRVLSDNGLINRVLNSTRDYALSNCSGARIISVTIRWPTNINFALVSANWMGGDQWNITQNNVSRFIQQEEAENAQKERQRADAARKEEEQRQAFETAKAMSQKLQADFIAQTGAQAWVNPQILKANPFPYKGKIVGMIESFQQMIGDSEGVFGGSFDVIASGVPNTLFTRPGMPVAIAIQVDGVKQIKMLGTDMAAVQGTYRGAYICKSQNCAEFIGPH